MDDEGVIHTSPESVLDRNINWDHIDGRKADGHGGTGLGLAVSRHVCRMMAGT
jgi:signal transduction histidine kinase